MQSTTIEIKLPLLADAQLLAKEYPFTFNLPTDEQYNDIGFFSLVQVCHKGERFWVSIFAACGHDEFYGTVNNELLQKELKLGDAIKLHKKNIYKMLWPHYPDYGHFLCPYT
jgi:hypothetical protein